MQFASFQLILKTVIDENCHMLQLEYTPYGIILQLQFITIID